MQYQITLAGNKYNVSGKKADVQRLLSNLKDAVNLDYHYKELTGVIGVSERELTLQSLFLPCGHPIVNKKEYDEAIPKLLAMIEGSKAADFPAIIEKAKEIYNKHIPILDNRRTPENEATHQAELKAIREEQERQSKINAEKDSKEKERLLKKYPYLIQYDNKISSHALAAKNIKIELSRLYPGVKFSVRSKSFSMGDDVNVDWENGPTQDEIQKIINKYSADHFDGMTDSYDYNITVFNNLFGGSKYVFGNRNITQDKYIETGKEYGHDIYYDGYNMKMVSNKEMTAPDIERMIQRGTHAKSFYIALVNDENKSMPSEITSSNPDISININEEKNGVEIKFSSKPDRSVLDNLKNAGFRWSKFQGIWWAKQNEKTLKIAEKLAA